MDVVARASPDSKNGLLSHSEDPRQLDYCANFLWVMFPQVPRSRRCLLNAWTAQSIYTLLLYSRRNLRRHRLYARLVVCAKVWPRFSFPLWISRHFESLSHVIQIFRLGARFSFQYFLSPISQVTFCKPCRAIQMRFLIEWLLEDLRSLKRPSSLVKFLESIWIVPPDKNSFELSIPLCIS